MKFKKEEKKRRRKDDKFVDYNLDYVVVRDKNGKIIKPKK